MTGFRGRITANPGKPEGRMRKLMGVSTGTYGLARGIGLEVGMRSTYDRFVRQDSETPRVK